MMPAFGDALSTEEIQRVLTYIRSFCSEPAWPRGELNLPRPLFTEKAYPEDEAVLTTTITAEGPGAVEHEFVYEKRFGARNQVELAVPLIEQQLDPGGWTTGIGDVALGFKRALHHSLETGTIFSAGGEVLLPTGSQSKDMGKGVPVFEPFLAFGQILPADSFVHALGGAELPAYGDEADKEAFWRVAAGKTLTQRGGFGRAWTPIVELLAAREIVEGARVDWDLVPQMQVTLSTRQHIMLNVGVRMPLNDAGPRQTQVVFYLLWDWFDGGLRDGW